jgi:hypothetical protein
MRRGLVRRRYGAAVLCGIAILALAAPAMAKKERDSSGQAAAPGGPPGAIVFTAPERRLILDYYAEPGHRAAASEKRLPPGIAKKVARGGALPPGIAKCYLPGELDARLPPPPGVERIVVGGDVILAEIATGLVYDVIKGVIGSR